MEDSDGSRSRAGPPRRKTGLFQDRNFSINEVSYEKNDPDADSCGYDDLTCTPHGL